MTHPFEECPPECIGYQEQGGCDDCDIANAPEYDDCHDCHLGGHGCVRVLVKKECGHSIPACKWPDSKKYLQDGYCHVCGRVYHEIPDD